MNIFYTPDIKGDVYTLDETESKHCIRVLRLKKGDTIYLIDGKGGFYITIISVDNPKACVVNIISSEFEKGKRNYYLHIAIAPTKNIERFEFFLEKATEIGVDEITPIICDFSERKVVKQDRLEKIVVSASKQSLNAYVPKLNPAKSFKEFIKEINVEDKFIAHCYESEKEYLTSVTKKDSNIVVMIGPEGDFSINEVNECIGSGWKEVSLGNTRLRTETAGIVVAHSVSLINL